MDFHLDSELRLNAASKNGWAIDEVGAKRQRTDQIPWIWSLYFTATSCILSESLEIRQSFKLRFNTTAADGTVTEHESGDEKEKPERSRGIHIKLRPGDARLDDDWRRTTYSMFGTNRVIESFKLDIHQLTDPAEEESCTAWGCVSYTSEGADFRDETSDDCLVFYLAVKPEAFARYVEQIDHGLVDEIILRVGHVDGFYADWSPSISTSNVKVLTRYPEHKVMLPPDYEAEPPRLGHVGEVALHINRKLEFERISVPKPDESELDESEPEIKAQAGTRLSTPANQASPAVVDGQILGLMRSLKRAAWFVVSLLALIFIVTLLRR